MSDSHELPFKTPKQLIAAIVASFVIPVIIIILLANYVSTGAKPAAGTNAKADESIAQRIKPVGTVEFVDASAPRVLKAGVDVYNAACAACHNAGAAGAPKLGDKAAWGARNGKGFETLWKHAVEGIGAMPAKGGNPDLDDIEVGRAVAYMANESGAKFAEPNPPASK